YRRNHLLRSKAAGDDWNRLPTPSGFHLSELWAQGSDVFLYGQSDRPQGGRLLESTDAGATWQTKPLPIEDLSCSPDVVQLPVIWVQCASGMTAGLWRSTDGGQTYVNPGKEGASAEPNAAVFAVAANDTVVVGFRDLRRTTDGGVHWHAVGPKLGRSTEWDYLGFTDARHGVGIRLSNAGPPPTRFGLWQTSDGGAHWTRVRIS
ncbi:MAG TPA: hypothetical protein VG708_02340, partial [Mycobacteriales bacterium]|nr:hypothetical protein [Mycobacteriales bacterium]